MLCGDLVGVAGPSRRGEGHAAGEAGWAGAARLCARPGVDVAPGRVEVQVWGPVGASAWGLGSRGFPPGRAVRRRGPRMSVQLQGRGVAVARLWCWFPCSVTLHRRVPRTRRGLTWVPGLWGVSGGPAPPAPSHPPLLPAPCSRGRQVPPARAAWGRCTRSPPSARFREGKCCRKRLISLPPAPRDRRAQQSHQGGCGRDPPGCFPACKTGSRQSERRPLPPFVSAPGSRGPLVCPVPAAWGVARPPDGGQGCRPAQGGCAVPREPGQGRGARRPAGQVSASVPRPGGHPHAPQAARGSCGQRRTVPFREIARRDLCSREPGPGRSQEGHTGPLCAVTLVADAPRPPPTLNL